MNCYAYAVGIDLNENDICSYAYNPGELGTCLRYYDSFRDYQAMSAYLHTKSFQDRIKYDMDALDISFEDACEDEDSEYVDENGYTNWLIAMYIQRPKFLIPGDIHFLRKTKDGIWVHKMGRDGSITSLDPNGNLIKTLPEELAFDKKRVYTNPSVYKLRMKR